MENTFIGELLASVIFLATFAGTLIFFVRSWKDGYWGKQGEDIKYQVFEDGHPTRNPDTEPRPKGAVLNKGAQHA